MTPLSTDKVYRLGSIMTPLSTEKVYLLGSKMIPLSTEKVYLLGSKMTPLSTEKVYLVGSLWTPSLTSSVYLTLLFQLIYFKLVQLVRSTRLLLGLHLALRDPRTLFNVNLSIENPKFSKNRTFAKKQNKICIENTLGLHCAPKVIRISRTVPEL